MASMWNFVVERNTPVYVRWIHHFTIINTCRRYHCRAQQCQMNGKGGKEMKRKTETEICIELGIRIGKWLWKHVLFMFKIHLNVRKQVLQDFGYAILVGYWCAIYNKHLILIKLDFQFSPKWKWFVCVCASESVYLFVQCSSRTHLKAIRNKLYAKQYSRSKKTRSSMLLELLECLWKAWSSEFTCFAYFHRFRKISLWWRLICDAWSFIQLYLNSL